MKLTDALRKIFFGQDSIQAEVEAEALQFYEITQFSIECAIALLAKTVAMAEFKFYKGETLCEAEDWYRWNFEPNREQNKQEFIFDLIQTMVRQDEALVVKLRGGMYVADKFQTQTDGFFGVTYTDVTRNAVTLERAFAPESVLHFRLQNDRARCYLAGVEAQYAGMLASAVQKYKKNNASKGLLKLQTGVGGGDPVEQRKRDAETGTEIAKFLSADRSAVVTLRKGMEYEELGKYHQGQSAEDITLLTREIFARTGEAFGIPAALLLGSGEATATKDNLEQLMRGAVRPLLDQIEAEATRKELGFDGTSGGVRFIADDARCRCISPLTAAEAIDKTIGSGGFSPDDIRNMCRAPRINAPWSRAHYLTANYQPIEYAERRAQDGKENTKRNA